MTERAVGRNRKPAASTCGFSNRAAKCGCFTEKVKLSSDTMAAGGILIQPPEIFSLPMNPPLPPFGHPLPLGGGEGWGEGAARRFKGAMRHQSSGESLPEGERQGEGERAGEKSQSLPAFGKERAHA